MVEDGYVAKLSLVPSRLLVTANRETSDVIRMVNLDGSYGPVVATGRGFEGVVTLREFAQLPQKIPFPDRIPFGRSMNWDLGSDGMLFSGWNDSINIAVMSINVPEERHISLIHDRIPISNAEMEDWLSYFGPETRAKFNERGLHTTKPAFEELLVDDNNRVWLELSATQDSTEVEWIVLDMDSRVVGKVRLPFDARLKAIRGGRVYAIESKGGAPRLLFTSSTYNVLVSVRPVVVSINGQHACQSEECPRELSHASHRLKSARPTATWIGVSYFGLRCLCEALLRLLINISAAHRLHSGNRSAQL